jgi:hypothetical protein
MAISGVEIALFEASREGCLIRNLLDLSVEIVGETEPLAHIIGLIDVGALIAKD